MDKNSMFVLIYFQQDATLHCLFISGKLLYMFRVISSPIIRSTYTWWRYHPKHVEQFSRNKPCKVASRWKYIQTNILTKHGILIVKNSVVDVTDQW